MLEQTMTSREHRSRSDTITFMSGYTYGRSHAYPYTVSLLPSNDRRVTTPDISIPARPVRFLQVFEVKASPATQGPRHMSSIGRGNKFFPGGIRWRMKYPFVLAASRAREPSLVVIFWPWLPRAGGIMCIPSALFPPKFSADRVCFKCV